MSPSIIVFNDEANVNTMKPGNVIYEQQQINGESGGTKRKRVRLVGGASGGPRIITAVVQVILRHLALGNDLLSSVVAPKIHSQLMPPYEAEVEARNMDISGVCDTHQPNIIDEMGAVMYLNVSNSIKELWNNRENPSATTPVEVSFADSVVNALEKMGHRMTTTTAVGITQFIGESYFIIFDFATTCLTQLHIYRFVLQLLIRTRKKCMRCQTFVKVDFLWVYSKPRFFYCVVLTYQHEETAALDHISDSMLLGENFVYFCF